MNSNFFIKKLVNLTKRTRIRGRDHILDAAERASVAHHPATSHLLDVIAREMHEIAWQHLPSHIPWEDLDPSDQWQENLIEAAYEKARKRITMGDRYEW